MQAQATVSHLRNHLRACSQRLERTSYELSSLREALRTSRTVTLPHQHGWRARMADKRIDTWPWAVGPIECQMCLRTVDGAWTPQGKCGRQFTICPSCLEAHRKDHP